MTQAKIKQRFLSKVRKTRACWEWRGTQGTEYGLFWFRTTNIGAHRAAYLLFKGPIPKGLQVCHRCDNPKCVRPSHLFLGTIADNIRDAAQKGRMACGAKWRRAHPQQARGEACGASKLLADQVRQARTLRRAGYLQREIAAEIGVNQTTVSRILRGVTWASA